MQTQYDDIDVKKAGIDDGTAGIDGIAGREDKAGFSYTYSAKEQAELKRIREKYQTKEETKMDKLRRLDARPSGVATKWSIITGVIGALIMGIGMSLTMTDIGYGLGIADAIVMAAGVIVGIAGIALVIAAYPLYNIVLKKERKKVAQDILKLTEELMK